MRLEWCSRTDDSKQKVKASEEGEDAIMPPIRRRDWVERGTIEGNKGNAGGENCILLSVEGEYAIIEVGEIE